MVGVGGMIQELSSPLEAAVCVCVCGEGGRGRESPL